MQPTKFSTFSLVYLENASNISSRIYSFYFLIRYFSSILIFHILLSYNSASSFHHPISSSLLIPKEESSLKIFLWLDCCWLKLKTLLNSQVNVWLRNLFFFRSWWLMLCEFAPLCYALVVWIYMLLNMWHNKFIYSYIYIYFALLYHDFVVVFIMYFFVRVWVFECVFFYYKANDFYSSSLFFSFFIFFLLLAWWWYYNFLMKMLLLSTSNIKHYLVFYFRER